MNNNLISEQQSEENKLSLSIAEKIRAHWIDANFTVNKITNVNEDESSFVFVLDPHCSGDTFILHGSDTYRLAQYALLYFATKLFYTHPELKPLKLQDKESEAMLTHIQIVKSTIQYRKPVFENEVTVTVKLKKFKNMLESKNLIFIDLDILINHGAHKVESTYIINMRL